ncbi:predicted protein [Arabidopsis lyrata subsp. lyrata]|uniref:Predicted protein n=1 Tax=Arabidopsis lyrata subsp. lyrata TaxID=81972 RepID=D7KBZ5_ARALL|nr:predicted protein [Arabidopsis lyrata subsp. lyrata]EFH70343.1 predicted protein [Arabidopsis lyrata subsp. lyrata]
MSTEHNENIEEPMLQPENAEDVQAEKRRKTPAPAASASVNPQRPHSQNSTPAPP